MQSIHGLSLSVRHPALPCVLCQTKMLGHKFECEHTPPEVKLHLLALGARSKEAKAFEEAYKKRKRLEEEQMEEGKAMQAEVKKQGAAPTIGEAGEREGLRQQQLEETAGMDRGITGKQAKTALFYLGLLFFMMNIPFVVVSSWAFIQFVRAIRPSFLKYLPHRTTLAGRMLREVFEEVDGLCNEKLNATSGETPAPP